MFGEQPADILRYHAFLLKDKSRVANYQAAISKSVKVGDIVLDIGTGTGILAFLARQAGAMRVYGIEINDSFDYAQAIAVDQGFGDHVSFIHGSSQHTALPERADVLISDTGGVFGIDGGLLGNVVDAKQRHLKPNHTLVPHRIDLYVAPVNTPDYYHSLIECWKAPLQGINYNLVRSFAVNNLYRLSTHAKDLLGKPALLASIDLRDSKTTTYFSARSICTADRDGELHGFCGWYKTYLAHDIYLSNSPIEPNVAWQTILFPLAQPVTLRSGDLAEISIKSNDGLEWWWKVEIKAGGTSSSISKARFTHSTFAGSPISKQRLKGLAASRAPLLSPMGEVELFALHMLDGKNTIAQIQKEALTRYPERFPSRAAAARFVLDIVEKYT
jgi:SAM-dependent methyltransferase